MILQVKPTVRHGPFFLRPSTGADFEHILRIMSGQDAFTGQQIVKDTSKLEAVYKRDQNIMRAVAERGHSTILEEFSAGQIKPFGMTSLYMLGLDENGSQHKIVIEEPDDGLEGEQSYGCEIGSTRQNKRAGGETSFPKGAFYELLVIFTALRGFLDSGIEVSGRPIWHCDILTANVQAHLSRIIKRLTNPPVCFAFFTAANELKEATNDTTINDDTAYVKFDEKLKQYFRMPPRAIPIMARWLLDRVAEGGITVPNGTKNHFIEVHFGLSDRELSALQQMVIQDAYFNSKPDSYGMDALRRSFKLPTELEIAEPLKLSMARATNVGGSLFTGSLSSYRQAAEVAVAPRHHHPFPSSAPIRKSRRAGFVNARSEPAVA